MGDLTYQEALRILRLVKLGKASTLDLEFEGTRIKVRRAAPAKAGSFLPENAAPAVPAPAKPAPRQEGATPSSAVVSRNPHDQRLPALAPGLVEIRPPMAGTFYAAPAPNSPPFAKEGDVVRKGDQLGIVEVMKLFTAIRSPCDGSIKAIFVKNHEVIGEDTVIMHIEKSE